MQRIVNILKRLNLLGNYSDDSKAEFTYSLIGIIWAKWHYIYFV